MSFRDILRSVVREVLGIVPSTPGPMTISRKEQLTVLRYHVALPSAPQIDDLASREVSISINAAAPTVQSLQPSATEFTFDCERNQSVSIVLVDIDTSTNRSLPSATLAFTSTDTVPPPQPGAPTVTLVEQL